jgi:uncharacterized protein (UPF0332 family)
VSLASELLDQAEMLVKREPKNPRQASLRRAVSAAYYALFHLLSEAAARQFAELCGRGDAGTVSRIARSFSHVDMKKAADVFGTPDKQGNYKLPVAFQTVEEKFTPSDGLKQVAATFSLLYQARMDADYDTGQPVTRPEALKRIAEAKEAFDAWEVVKGSPDARLLLACFSLLKTWNVDRNKQQ